MDWDDFFNRNQTQKSKQQMQSSAASAIQHHRGHILTSLRGLGKKISEKGTKFGLGNASQYDLSVSPGLIVQNVQLFLVNTMANMMKSAGMIPSFPRLPELKSGVTSSSLQKGIDHIGGEITKLGMDPMKAPAVKVVTSKLLGSPPEKVMNEHKEESKTAKLGQGAHFQSYTIQTLIEHHKVIEELKKENEILRRILEEHFKVPRSKLQPVDDKSTKPTTSSRPRKHGEQS